MPADVCTIRAIRSTPYLGEWHRVGRRGENRDGNGDRNGEVRPEWLERDQ